MPTLECWSGANLMLGYRKGTPHSFVSTKHVKITAGQVRFSSESIRVKLLMRWAVLVQILHPSRFQQQCECSPSSYPYQLSNESMEHSTNCIASRGISPNPKNFNKLKMHNERAMNASGFSVIQQHPSRVAVPKKANGLIASHIALFG